MIPVDIDNFIIIGIGIDGENTIFIKENFSKIPREIGNCYSLKYIDLSYNEIEDISAVSNCYFLKELVLYYNQKMDISSIYNCSSLERLYLTINKKVDKSSLATFLSLNTTYININHCYIYPTINNNTKIFLIK